MKQAIRSFSIGLFSAGLIMLIVFNFNDNKSDKKAKELTVDEMIEEIKFEGYRVISESEYIKMSLQEPETEKTEKELASAKIENDENSKQDSDKEDKKDKETDDKQDKDNVKKEKQEKTKAKDDKANAKKEDNKDSVKKYTINIKSGMPSSDIGDLLAENKIIKDANKFNKYLEKEGYSTKVQLGKFKVNSDMSYYELAEAITR